MGLSVRTLLFTDIEGSTSLQERAGDRFPDMLARHRQIVRDAVQRHGGIEHSTEGDSFFITFDSPTAALAAAVAAQCGLECEPWPEELRLRVRMGMHLGEVQEHDNDLVGMAINHAARVAAAAHGGQIILTEAVRATVRAVPSQAELRPIGSHRLRDVGTIGLFQVDHPLLQEDFPPPRGVLGYRSNLPLPPTPLVGGDGLLHSLAEQLDAGRIVTLTGTGGVGKTRAAIEFGHRHLAEFDQAVFFTDLSPISDSGAVVAALAASLPIVVAGEQLFVQTIQDWIGDRRVLLIVDNCEHVVDEVGAILDALISNCPNLRVVTTSREALGVAGERVQHVPSLDPGSTAVELFCQRAGATDHSFTSEGHRDAIVQICTRLDGIPLAIELAAARMRSLSAEDLLERLQDRFRLLRGSGRAKLDRHHTLRAMVSWSYQLLTDDERLFFDRTSVFAGGFDMRAAEAVCGFEPLDTLDVMDLVSSLVDKSMIVVERAPAGTRYRLLETLRQFAEEMLEQRGEILNMRNRHALHVAEVMTELDVLIRGARQREGSARMAVEWDNLRAAHLWSLSCADLDVAERLVASSFQYAVFQLRHEHAVMLERTVQLGDELGRPSTSVLGMLSYWRDLEGDEAESRRLAQRGIDVAATPEDPATDICWFEFAGATATGKPEAEDTVDAFRHEAAALAAMSDLDHNWFSVLNLTDASLHAEPAATPGLRRQLADIAARVQSPRLNAFVHQFEGHARLFASPPDFAAALGAYTRMVENASALDDMQLHVMGLRCLALASTGLRAPDALARCHDALAMLHELRYWQKLRQTLESVALALAQAGRIEHSAVVLGHLDVHTVGFGLEHRLGFRQQARAIIDSNGDHEADTLRGARMTAEELVVAALDFCSEAPHDDITR